MEMRLRAAAVCFKQLVWGGGCKAQGSPLHKPSRAVSAEGDRAGFTRWRQAGAGTISTRFRPLSLGRRIVHLQGETFAVVADDAEVLALARLYVSGLFPTQAAHGAQGVVLFVDADADDPIPRR